MMPFRSTPSTAGLRALMLGAALAVAGCSSTSHPSPSPGQQLQFEEGTNWDKLHHELLNNYYVWLNSPQHSCSSHLLTGTANDVVESAKGVSPDFRFKDRYDAGSWVIEVANGATLYGCGGVARPLFDFVLENYPGEGFGTLRDDAQAGLEHITQSAARP